MSIISKTIIAILLLFAGAGLQMFLSSEYEQYYNKTLLSDVQYLLSAEEKMDYEDPRLQKILNKYDYHLFKAYKAFIEFEQSAKSTADLDKAKKVLLDINKSAGRLTRDFERNGASKARIMDEFFNLFVSGYAIVDDLEKALPGERKKNWDNGYKYIKIPLWLVARYPAVVNEARGAYGLVVNAKKSVKDIPGFYKLLSIIHDIRGGCISTMYGYERFDAYRLTKHFIDVVSFNPKGYVTRNLSWKPCMQQVIQDRLSYLQEWAEGSEENMLKYQEFLLCFDKVAKGLADYYQNNYNLGKYADRAEDILSYYVYEHTHRMNDVGT